MIVAVTNNPAHIIVSDATLLENDLETIGTVHYKSLENKDTQMTCHKGVVVKNAPNLKLD